MDIDHDHVGDAQLRVRRSAGQWAKLIAAQRDSGVSIVSFCQRHDLAVSTFHAWRRRLAPPEAPEAPQTPQAPKASAGPRPEAATSADQTFVRLRVSGDVVHDAGDGSPVVVRFADGVEVHVGGERLGEVLGLLRAASVGRLPSHESIRQGGR